MVFERFMELIMPRNRELFERIVYIPGNHDHHLWEFARETQYVEYIRKLRVKELPIPWHTTNMFVRDGVEQVHSYFLTNLIKRSEEFEDFPIFTAYPNFGLLNEGHEKCVIFHHGHFVEPRYQLMTTLRNLIFPGRKKPRQIWDIEAENFAWIDFFWSTMGRSGEVGHDIELIYEKMQNKREFKELLYSLADGVSRRLGLPGWIGVTIAKILTLIFSGSVGRITGSERTHVDHVLSEGVRNGLVEYMNGPLKEQVLAEKGRMLREMAFVFGHTHKPYQERLEADRNSAWRAVYNTGGWVVETVRREPMHGGAVVLVDENLNLTSLRMYDESEDLGSYVVEVASAGERENPFHERIVKLVKERRKTFREFSKVVGSEIEGRAQMLKSRSKKRE